MASCGTKIEGDELFKFDKEVEPILGVLCTKLLEQSRMEVLEEEELRTIRSQQTHYQDLKKDAEMETKRLEQEELKRQEEIVRFQYSLNSVILLIINVSLYSHH